MNPYQQYCIELKQSLDLLPWNTIHETVCLLHEARIDQRHVFIIGNGGSASTASHMACDLGKNTQVSDIPGFRVLSLTDNNATITAYANDCGYENVFANQLASFVQPNDILVAISASGNSANILNAVKLAQSRKAMTVGWSGYDGGELAKLVDLPLVINNYCIEQIEDIHLMLAHIVTQSLRQAGTSNGVVMNPSVNVHSI
ncbi:SIS domain-containing protein [Chloroflexi bacterium TSY]|nr:SIS domain-containing protein [Chloroflexi bacterium TSY]